MSETRIIGFVSGKGGVGKTTVCLNTAIALQDLGATATVVDTDFSASNLSTYLGNYDHPVTIQDVLDGDDELQDAIFRHKSGIRFISSSNEIDKVEPDLSGLRELFEEAGQEQDYVLIDCPPGISATVKTIMDACDEIFVVTEPTQTAGVNAAQVVEQALDLKKPVLGTVINKVDDDPDKELIEREIEIMTNSHVINKIPYDDTVKESQFHHTPVIEYAPNSEAAVGITKLAHHIEGKQFKEDRFSRVKRMVERIKEKVTR